LFSEIERSRDAELTRAIIGFDAIVVADTPSGVERIASSTGRSTACTWLVASSPP